MEAINTLVEVLLEKAGDVSRELGHGPAGSGRAYLVKSGYQIQKIEGKSRRQRDHRFEVLADFAAWLKRHVSEEALLDCEILVEPRRVVALLEPLSRHGDRVTCSLVEDATFAAWKAAVVNGPISQREFHLLVRAHGRVLAEREQMMALLGRISVTTANAGEEQIDVNGLRKMISGTRTQQASIVIPSVLNLRTPILEGLDQPHELEVFLTPEVVEGPALVFRLDCPLLDATIREARGDLAVHLQNDLLGGGWLVGVGEARTEVVPVVS